MAAVSLSSSLSSLAGAKLAVAQSTSAKTSKVQAVRCVAGPSASSAGKRAEEKSIWEKLGTGAAAFGLAAALQLTPSAVDGAKADEFAILRSPPPLESHYYDDANVLSRITRSDIKKLLTDLEERTGFHIDAVTLRKIAGKGDVFELADRILESWYPTVEEGDKRGVVLLVTSQKEGAVAGGPTFIETIGDEVFEGIVSENLPVLATEERYNEAMYSTTKRLVARINGEPDIPGSHPFISPSIPNSLLIQSWPHCHQNYVLVLETQWVPCTPCQSFPYLAPPPHFMFLSVLPISSSSHPPNSSTVPCILVLEAQQYWSWKPNGCPASGMRFDAPGFLKLMKNKVFASVGESISVRGFLLAVVCNIAKFTQVKMLAKPNKFGDTEVYVVPSYNVTLVNFWAQFLVAIDRSNQTLARFGNTKPALQDTVVNLHKLDPSWAAKLDLIHVIVLQTATDWPAGRGLMRRYYADANWNAIKPAPSTYEAYEIGMRTVFSAFAGRNKRGKPFPVPYFLSAPPRLNGCQNVSSLSSPQQVTSLFNDNKASKGFLPIQQKVFQNRRPFRFLPITYLSMFRGDAFMSSSGAHDGGRDCLHFCLPGVPDTWADALYTTMKNDRFIVNNAAK
ncbi:unnamed protein product [Closterium sp. NIES-65]|nr:unnamed protein product [Closterium sp. NIES-65]